MCDTSRGRKLASFVGRYRVVNDKSVSSVRTCSIYRLKVFASLKIG